MEVRYTPVFWKLYDAVATHPRYVASRGSARSSKTVSALQLLDLLVRHDQPGDITSVVSETLPHLKRGAVRDFETVVVGLPLKSLPNWNASDLVYTYPGGGKLEFFSADAPSKVLGPARKRLFVNEANHIGYDTFVQLDIRTKGLVLYDYNPEATFWGTDIVELRDTARLVHSTYLNNPFLTPEQVAAIEANRGNTNWWKVYGLGEIGSLEGQIYDFDLVDALPAGDRSAGLRELYGLDFGFSNDPTAIVHLVVDPATRDVWVDEVCYRTRMFNTDIVEALRAEGVDRYTDIFADCEDPKSIAEIGTAGFAIHPSDKRAPSKNRLAWQLQWMQGWTLHFTKRSVNLIREGRAYVWAKDRYGNDLNQPEEGNDHALDAMRYALWTAFAENANKGNYNIRLH